MYSKLNGGKNIIVDITCGLLIAMEIDKGIGKDKEALISI